jgi:hypothetical protein
MHCIVGWWAVSEEIVKREERVKYLKFELYSPSVLILRKSIPDNLQQALHGQTCF